MASPRRCTGCCRATSVRARPWSRSPRCSSAVQGGYQGAFMAPTEVLAEQHELASRALLDGLTVPAERLAARRAAGARRAAHEPHDRRRAPAHRRPGCAAARSTSSSARTRCSTATPSSRNLGVAVIDEQHRFGVEQRALLRGKGDEPDVLVMTATPIPRTAAMLVYGDLDKSELREMPPGRTPIATKVVGPEPARPGRGVRSACATRSTAGRQAYVVCPLVEEQGQDRGARPRPRSSSGCRQRSSRACGSGCCTGRCRRRRRKR